MITAATARAAAAAMRAFATAPGACGIVFLYADQNEPIGFDAAAFLSPLIPAESTNYLLRRLADKEADRATREAPPA